MALPSFFRAAIAMTLYALASAPHASGADVVFSINEPRRAVAFDSEGMRALLALYSLENGAGCEGKDEDGLVRCALTQALGLGSNCSDKHVQLVRLWFEKTPRLTSRWNERWNAKAKEPGSLESLCYGQPDTASWQNIWESIQVAEADGVVSVNAILVWGSQNGRGRVRYRNTFRVGANSIEELSSEITELTRSSESAFGTDEQ